MLQGASLISPTTPQVSGNESIANLRKKLTDLTPELRHRHRSLTLAAMMMSKSHKPVKLEARGGCLQRFVTRPKPPRLPSTLSYGSGELTDLLAHYEGGIDHTEVAGVRHHLGVRLRNARRDRLHPWRRHARLQRHALELVIEVG